MNKLARLIERLPHTELLKLQKDLKTGNLDKLINNRLDDISPTKAKYCPICNAEVPEDNLTLIFGPAAFRQKASFDGPDCLIYFLDQLQKKGRKQQEQPLP
ncbi:hypothetical protein GF367_01030 [Candidatus Woesearchaeota archaeon]|nr:hypothetical protein [Candidatus Woesearchaeota archaeon]